jgi:late competence protein required for DNA uptake (superfamily II DNA/RNA helicase)
MIQAGKHISALDRVTPQLQHYVLRSSCCSCVHLLDRATDKRCGLPCFTAGLLKVVAATETLAAGINMPARTTVIGSLSRRQNVGHVLLKHNQLLQMAGRAGRRGFDIAGAAVPCPSP